MGKLTYKKTGGVLSLQVKIENIPSWSYLYNEDQEHSNNSSNNKSTEHTLGKPHELNRPIHDWIFTLNNTLDESVTGVNVHIEWSQEINGESIPIESWSKLDISIKKNDGVIIEDRIILNPE